MRLVPDWREAWKWFSVQAMAILAALPVVWMSLPADLKAHVPNEWGLVIFIIVAIGGIGGRVIDQKPKAPTP